MEGKKYRRHGDAECTKYGGVTYGWTQGKAGKGRGRLYRWSKPVQQVMRTCPFTLWRTGPREGGCETPRRRIWMPSDVLSRGRDQLKWGERPASKSRMVKSKPLPLNPSPDNMLLNKCVSSRYVRNRNENFPEWSSWARMDVHWVVWTIYFTLRCEKLSFLLKWLFTNCRTQPKRRCDAKPC